LSSRRNARCARSVREPAANPFAVDQQIKPVKKLSTGAGHSPQSMLQTQPHQLEISHGFEKKTGEA
jgi:hypothetical protein